MYSEINVYKDTKYKLLIFIFFIKNTNRHKWIVYPDSQNGYGVSCGEADNDYITMYGIGKTAQHERIV